MSTQSGYIGPRRSLVERAVAAARLDIGAFEEVEADTTATSQAATVVALSAVAQGIAAYNQGIGAIIGSLIGALVGWIVWSVVTYFVGTTLFKGTATVGELLRTLGFAQAPGVLYIVGVIPVLGWIATIAIAIWILIAAIIAIRQALDISTGQAIITGIIGWLIVVIPLMIFGAAASLIF
ncbi:MAG: YIP1 family protein [Gemmatimonadota bacterium]